MSPTPLSHTNSGRQPPQPHHFGRCTYEEGRKDEFPSPMGGPAPKDCDSRLAAQSPECERRRDVSHTLTRKRKGYIMEAESFINLFLPMPATSCICSFFLSLGVLTKVPQQIHSSAMDLNKQPPGTDLSKVPCSPPPPGRQSNFIDPPSQAWQPRLAIYMTLPLTIIFVVLRVYTRFSLKHGLKMDDCKSRHSLGPTTYTFLLGRNGLTNIAGKQTCAYLPA
jgi:hypothetical protein